MCQLGKIANRNDIMGLSQRMHLNVFKRYHCFNGGCTQRAIPILI